MKKAVLVIISFIILAGIGLGTYIFLNRKESNSQNISLSNQGSVVDSNINKNNGETRQFTLNEVAVNNSRNSCWLIIDSKVYDVTSYLREHPGGSGEILPVCGKEATNAFNTMNKSSSKGHSPKASEILSGYLVGSIKN